MNNWLAPPEHQSRYVLGNARIPASLCSTQARNGWCDSDILIDNGRIAGLASASSGAFDDAEIIDAGGGIVTSALVDCHVHLDKAHVAQGTDFPPCDLAGAKDEMVKNKLTWTPEDLRARVEFSLQCAFASGVRAMRSHVDFAPDTLPFVWPDMQAVVAEWKGKVDVQLCPLTSIETLADEAFRASIFKAAAGTGVLGLFLYDQPDLPALLRPVFEQAQADELDLDLHVDEGLEPELDGLNAVAQTVMATNFKGSVLCGHCVSLLSYEPARRARVIGAAVEAGIHFVSLPVTNLYLQGRSPGHAPVSRGMAPVIDIIKAGGLLSLGADNVRDGFSAFGEFDPISVLSLAAQVAHLHEPGRDYISLITTNPARALGLDWDGEIRIGAPADLVVFEARSSSELCARPSAERAVLRSGRWIEAGLPSYRQLDNLKRG